MTLWRRLAAALALAVALGSAFAQRLRNGDYIVVVVNQELVTAAEIEGRMQRAQQEAARTGARLPPANALRQQVMDSLIDERVIVSHARESGTRVDESDVDRAVQNVAAQNQVSLEQLRTRLRAEGIDYVRFRANLRDQLLIERTREREVYALIKISDSDIDRYIEEQRSVTRSEGELNLAQILVTVPEGADAATLAARQARAEGALARVRGGEDFGKVAREISEDGNKARGGEIGLRPLTRLPDVFVEAVSGLGTGAVMPTLLRSGAGFHALKVLERKEAGALQVTQTRVRHILLRPSAELSPELAARRLSDYRRQIEAGSARFEDLARQYSEDGSAQAGGDLGWATPGMMVPEFEEGMNKLALGGLSPPVVSRFGLHLIQVLERRQVAVEMKQVREQARNVLREQKFDEAYSEWAKDLRDRAYIEMREPPQ